ncbi:MAG TPA: glycosyltransferase [Candidatus Paceibacterota bacterium]|nr:glycosyltransferase [Candidatus Paceibacterota bacterium]
MSVAQVALYVILFLATYAQLFLLVTFLGKRKELNRYDQLPDFPATIPTVAVVVPCWNEQATVHGTVESLLALDYPKDRFEIIIVDDGSTDSTWNEILKYKGHPQVRMFQKENGGKHTAVNFGLTHTTADLVGCIDADSFVAPDALRRIVAAFARRPDAMAVCPSIIIYKPKGILQHIQRAEYNLSLYIKKALSFANGLHVVPGPFSFFRREVFEKIGPFRKAHNTEDAEIAFRMQINHMKIEHCHQAHVYTVAPKSIPGLIRQRTRWIYGFIQNTRDYRKYLLKGKYGTFSLFTVPMGFVSIGTLIYIFWMLLWAAGVYVAKKYIQFHTVGIHTSAHLFHVDPFFINTSVITVASVLLYSFLFVTIFFGHKIADEKKIPFHYIIVYVLLYIFLEPIWLMKALWNAVTAQKPKWR